MLFLICACTPSARSSKHWLTRYDAEEMENCRTVSSLGKSTFCPNKICLGGFCHVGDVCLDPSYPPDVSRTRVLVDSHRENLYPGDGICSNTFHWRKYNYTQTTCDCPEGYWAEEKCNSDFPFFVCIGCFGEDEMYVGPLPPNTSAAQCINKSCLEPNGTDSCEFYINCIDESRGLSCGENGYARSFGYKYCERFRKNTKGYSENGKTFLANVRPCLQKAMVPFISSTDEFSCEDISTFGFHSHRDCYIMSGYCDTALQADRLRIAETVMEDIATWALWKQFAKIETSCWVDGKVSFIDIGFRSSPLLLTIDTLRKHGRALMSYMADHFPDYSMVLLDIIEGSVIFRVAVFSDESQEPMSKTLQTIENTFRDFPSLGGEISATFDSLKVLNITDTDNAIFDDSTSQASCWMNSIVCILPLLLTVVLAFLI